MSVLRAPFPWFGGKSRAAELVWERFGNPANYVEPFAGSLAVLLGRPGEPNLETVNDRDCYLSNFWRAVMCKPELVAQHANWPVNEADLHARHLWLVKQAPFRERMLADPEYFDARIAGWWVWGISQWIGGNWCNPDFGDGRGRRPNIKSEGLQLIQPGRTNGGRAPRGIHAAWAQRPDLTSSRGVHGRKGVEAYGEWIYDRMQALADRLRRVRVCCGDWSRVVTPSVTYLIGGQMLTAVLLDPPYAHDTGRDSRLYSVEGESISAAVRTWALANGDNPLLRIALCGYEGEHTMPASWQVVEWWKANGGYANQRAETPGKRNATRERIWFSPHCLRQSALFAGESA